MKYLFFFTMYVMMDWFGLFTLAFLFTALEFRLWEWVRQ